jgi:hypothetical protein
VLDDFSVRYGWGDFGTPGEDGLGGGRIRFGVPLVLIQGAAQDAVVGARVDVGPAGRMELISHRQGYARVGDAYDLAPYRVHREVADQIPCR